MKKTTLIIDAGHGGINPENGEYTTLAYWGKKTNHGNNYEFHKNGWFYEGVSNRKYADDFCIKAISKGYNVVKIYHQYLDWTLAERCALENKYYNAFDKNTLLLSFHSNAISMDSFPQNKARGFTIHTLKKNNYAGQIASKICNPINNYYKKFGAGRSENLLHYELIIDMHTNTHSPAITLENLFFDNTQDSLLLMSDCTVNDFNNILINELDKYLI